MFRDVNSGSAAKLVCYFTNWVQYREGAACFLPKDVDPSLYTHLIRTFAGMDSHQLSSIEWNEETLYKEFHGLWKMNSKLKTLLAIGGWSFGTQKNLDFQSLMAYDFHGSWKKTTGHDSSLCKRQGACGVMDRLKVCSWKGVAEHRIKDQKVPYVFQGIVGAEEAVATVLFSHFLLPPYDCAGAGQGCWSSIYAFRAPQNLMFLHHPSPLNLSMVPALEKTLHARAKLMGFTPTLWSGPVTTVVQGVVVPAKQPEEPGIQLLLQTLHLELSLQGPFSPSTWVFKLKIYCNPVLGPEQRLKSTNMEQKGMHTQHSGQTTVEISSFPLVD
ncbi:hypothetical protein E5288_WYG010492 [Bos mutus]|uniref:GH18 domain-containing protein n=1 Tax=Bos mutus TaxID=72004 RepID=A0A6B0S545_9CETA|nr:hypothetical protein [Bos mutus]